MTNQKTYICVLREGETYLREVNPYELTGKYGHDYELFEHNVQASKFPEGIEGNTYLESDVELVWQYKKYGDWFTCLTNTGPLEHRQIYRLRKTEPVRDDTANFWYDLGYQDGIAAELQKNNVVEDNTLVDVMVSRNKVVEILKKYGIGGDVKRDINNLK